MSDTIECLQCGECCRTLKSVRITREEFETLKQFGEPNVVPIENDRFDLLLPCQYQKDNKCTVWDVRPCMCRMWHCGKLKEDDPILEWQSEIQKLMSNNPEYAEFKTKMEDEAVDWGNNHGWKWRR